jgi:hypothetical protein
LTKFLYEDLAPRCASEIGAASAAGEPLVADDPESLDTYLNFLEAVSHGDYVSVKECLRLMDPLPVHEEERLYRLIADLNRIQIDTRHARLWIPLPSDGTPQLPDPNQYALISDSADHTRQTITLYGGRNLDVSQLHPRILLKDSKDAWLLPSTIATVPAGHPPSLEINLNSPSTLSSLEGSASADTSDSRDQIASLEIVIGSDDPGGCGSASHACYSNFLKVAATPTDPCKGTPMKVSAPLLRTTVNASGIYSAALNVSFGDMATFLKPCTAPEAATSGASAVFTPPLYLDVQNADVGLTPPPAGGTAPASCIVSAAGKLQLPSTGKCASSLTFQNLSPGLPVILSVKDAKGAPLPSTSTTLGVMDAFARP